MTRLRNSTILITGGASGIGRLMGLMSLERGADKVIIWDINQQNLQQVTAEMQAKGKQVFPYEVDVADVAAVAEAAGHVLQESGPPDILINNAGIVVGKMFADHSYAEIAQTLSVNVLGVMAVARAFLPGMIERGSGHVVNIASAAGTGGPGTRPARYHRYTKLHRHWYVCRGKGTLAHPYTTTRRSG
ncbi:SDR family NAD(P)-dependent oxidoreductase [Pontibacter toksunensis]|uniref:SDR family NAD(P)-dependent oxidoreductase n=1 Tax=Pontibacter toksunensis TaxID=1332631 RepID=A0ABW6BPB4_9BACT